MRGGVSWDMSSTVIQSGRQRRLGGYQANLLPEPHSPAPAWHMQHQIEPKPEPVDEERHDSGINSDSHSSPGSDHGQNYNENHYSSANPQNQAPTYYTTSIIPRVPTSGVINYHQNMQANFNPLTPPIADLSTSPNINHFSPSKNEPSKENLTLTPESSPTLENENRQEGNENPLRRLQMTLEKNGFFPQSLSPKLSEHSMDDDNKSDVDIDEYDEQGLRVPKVNSHGKVKTFKCKQCDFVAVTKIDFWEHSKQHIKVDKLLTCTKCPFVTEYKHHLEYHLRNHYGSKPFKCSECSYSCVNKSMLNSHMKSHSNVYQYRCASCTYATKYCHSLKLHLRKYDHKPAMVLNPDGTPNPLPIIDVYGTRRGPKQKLQSKRESVENCSQAIQNSLAQIMLNASPQVQLPFPYQFLSGFPGALGNSLLFQQNLVQMAAQCRVSPELNETLVEPSSSSERMDEVEDSGVLDLSKPDIAYEKPSRSRRKGRAFKIDHSSVKQTSSDEDELGMDLVDSNQHSDDTSRSSSEEKTDTKEENRTEENSEEVINNNKPGNYSCQYCCISFGDVILYTMHMGYHGYKDPFTCNMCGEECNDKVSFFLHIARTSHS